MSFFALSAAPFEKTDIPYKHTLKPLQSCDPHTTRHTAKQRVPNHLKVVPPLVGFDAIVVGELHCKMVILRPKADHGLAPFAIIGTGDTIDIYTRDNACERVDMHTHSTHAHIHTPEHLLIHTGTTTGFEQILEIGMAFNPVHVHHAASYT